MMLLSDALANSPDRLAGLATGLPCEAAAVLAALGLPVFPTHTIDGAGRCSCRSDCGRTAGKHPRTANGLLHATTDSDQIGAWWQRWPDANIAVATGATAGIWVLDIDPDKGGEQTVVQLEATHGFLPQTWCVETGGGGLHLWFQYPNEQLRNSAGALGLGLDVRADGGYVIVPPSRHQSGDRYRWADGWHPTRVDLALAPAWLIELARRGSPPEMIPPDVSLLRHTSGGNHVPQLPAVIAEGHRNATLTRLAGSMRHKGFGEAAIHAALLAENVKRCVPPLPEIEITRIAHSVSRYAPAIGGWRPRRPSRAKTFVEFIDGKAVAR